MKRALVLFLGLFIHFLPTAQDLPPEILADQYLLEATKAIENGDLNKAYMKFGDIEDLDVEPPAEFLFYYGKFLVENSFPASHENDFLGGFKERLDYLHKGESFLKQYVLSIERGSEHYASALELLSVAAEKVDESQKQLRRDEYATEQAARLPMGEMVSIPGGTFQMGDLSGEGQEWGKPVRSVMVPAFKLGKHEVTVGQFRSFVEATGYRTDAERNADGNEGCYIFIGDNWTPGRSWRSPGYSVGDDQPVVCVSWNDAQAFIEWLNGETGGSYRLPTESEWEYAVRAGTTTKYHFGNDESRLCRYGNFADRSTNFDWRNESCSDGVGERTATVGRYQPNSYGLYDMHGNVWEWVGDCWNESYSGAPSNGSAWENGDCNQRVLRGGSWGIPPAYLRSAFRLTNDRAGRANDLGFRLAQDN